jgi:mevalonate kinase
MMIASNEVENNKNLQQIAAKFSGAGAGSHLIGVMGLDNCKKPCGHGLSRQHISRKFFGKI